MNRKHQAYVMLTGALEVTKAGRRGGEAGPSGAASPPHSSPPTGISEGLQDMPAASSTCYMSVATGREASVFGDFWSQHVLPLSCQVPGPQQLVLGSCLRFYPCHPRSAPSARPTWPQEAADPHPEQEQPERNPAGAAW